MTKKEQLTTKICEYVSLLKYLLTVKLKAV